MTRDDVIKGLECLTHIDSAIYKAECEKRQCPYRGLDCEIAVMVDALDALKAQEPRVMTLDEVKVSEKPVWLEWRYRFIKPAYLHSDQVMIGCRNAITFVLFGDEKWYIYADNDYGVEVRCWTSRPSDAQREATPWS